MGDILLRPLPLALAGAGDYPWPSRVIGGGPAARAWPSSPRRSCWPSSPPGSWRRRCALGAGRSTTSGAPPSSCRLRGPAGRRRWPSPKRRLVAYDEAVAAQPAADNPGAAALQPGNAGTASPGRQADPCAGPAEERVGRPSTGDCTGGSCCLPRPGAGRAAMQNKPAGTPAKTDRGAGGLACPAVHGRDWAPSRRATAGKSSCCSRTTAASAGIRPPERDADCNDFNAPGPRLRPEAAPGRRIHGRLADPQGRPVRDRGARYLDGIKALHRRRHRGGGHPGQPAVHT